MTTKKDINLVLSGGSARGLAHIGVLSVLEKHFNIRSIIGTSMGAIIGGLYSYGYTPAEMVTLTKDIRPGKSFSIFRPSLRKSGFFDGNAILKYFQEQTKDISIEDCNIPFAAVAFDMNSTRTIVIDKGTLAKALRASSSLPLLIEPFPYGKYLFVDGYIEHPFPLKFAAHYGRHEVIGSSVFPLLPEDSSQFMPSGVKSGQQMPGLLNVFFKSMLYNQASMALQSTITNKPDIFISCFARGLKFWELDEVDEFFKIGEKAAQQAVDNHLADKDKSAHKNFYDGLTEKYGAFMNYLKSIGE